MGLLPSSSSESEKRSSVDVNDGRLENEGGGILKYLDNEDG